MFGRGVQYAIKNGHNQIYGFINMRVQKDLRAMKRGSTGSKIKEKCDAKC